MTKRTSLKDPKRARYLKAIVRAHVLGRVWTPPKGKLPLGALSDLERWGLIDRHAVGAAWEPTYAGLVRAIQLGVRASVPAKNLGDDQ